MNVKNLFKSDDSMAKPLQKGKTLFILALVIIPILNFIVFWVIVNINSFVLAFQVYDRTTKSYFLSLGQFETVFTDLKNGMDGELLPAFGNTMIYFWVNLLIMLPSSYLVSYFLYKKITFYGFFRVIFFMPSIISSVVLVAVYKNFLLPGGVVDSVVRTFGGTMPNFLNTHDGATGMMLGYVIWSGFGVNVVLYQSAMKRIPESVIEAAKLDGVGMWREIFQIVTPLVWSTIMTTLTLAISAFLTADGPILLFTEGTQKTSTISFYIYWIVYKKSQHNYGAAIGIVCSLISMPIVFGSRYLLSKVFENVEY